MNQKARDYTLLLLRMIIVIIFLFHGYPKAVDWSMAMEKFQSFGFPGFLGPVVGIFEVLAALALLIGFWTRFSATILAVIIFVATTGVQIPEALSEGVILHPGLERDLMIFGSLLFLSLHGPGALAIQTKRLPVVSRLTEDESD